MKKFLLLSFYFLSQSCTEGFPSSPGGGPSTSSPETDNSNQFTNTGPPKAELVSELADQHLDQATLNGLSKDSLLEIQKLKKDKNISSEKLSQIPYETLGDSNALKDVDQDNIDIYIQYGSKPETAQIMASLKKHKNISSQKLSQIPQETIDNTDILKDMDQDNVDIYIKYGKTPKAAQALAKEQKDDPDFIQNFETYIDDEYKGKSLEVINKGIDPKLLTSIESTNPDPNDKKTKFENKLKCLERITNQDISDGGKKFLTDDKLTKLLEVPDDKPEFYKILVDDHDSNKLIGDFVKLKNNISQKTFDSIDDPDILWDILDSYNITSLTPGNNEEKALKKRLEFKKNWFLLRDDLGPKELENSNKYIELASQSDIPASTPLTKIKFSKDRYEAIKSIIDEFALDNDTLSAEDQNANNLIIKRILRTSLNLPYGTYCLKDLVKLNTNGILKLEHLSQDDKKPLWIPNLVLREEIIETLGMTKTEIDNIISIDGSPGSTEESDMEYGSLLGYLKNVLKKNTLTKNEVIDLQLESEPNSNPERFRDIQSLDEMSSYNVNKKILTFAFEKLSQEQKDAGYTEVDKDDIISGINLALERDKIELQDINNFDLNSDADLKLFKFIFKGIWDIGFSKSGLLTKKLFTYATDSKVREVLESCNYNLDYVTLDNIHKIANSTNQNLQTLKGIMALFDFTKINETDKLPGSQYSTKIDFKRTVRDIIEKYYNDNGKTLNLNAVKDQLKAHTSYSQLLKNTV